MSVAYWPTTLPQIPQARTFSGGPQDPRASFQPMHGAPIERPAVTGMTHLITAVFRQLSWVQLSRFETFVETDLAQGTAKFIWRHPVSSEPRWWRIARAGGRLYQVDHMENGRVNVSLGLYLMPSAPWFADYIPKGVSRVPYFVADYDNAIYGIDGAKVANTDLPTIAGTYLVERTTTTAVTFETETLVATDIPSSAPAGTTKIIGFTPL